LERGDDLVEASEIITGITGSSPQPPPSRPSA